MIVDESRLDFNLIFNFNRNIFFIYKVFNDSTKIKYKHLRKDKNAENLF